MKSTRLLSTAFPTYALSCIFSVVFCIFLHALAPTQAIGQCAGYKIDVPNACTCDGPNGRSPVTIKVTAAAAQTWTVKALNGLYDPMNPSLFISIGTPLTDAGGGMYTLDALRLNTDGYWIQVTNGACDLDIRVGNPNPVPCAAGLLTVSVDPDGTPDTGDEYTLYVFPTDNSAGILWGPETDIPGLDNKANNADASADFDGMGNTQKIVAALGDNGGTPYAAKLCADLVYNGCDDWYLPAAGELNAMYQQLGPGGMNGFVSFTNWSSTEHNGSFAWRRSFADGLQDYVYKSVSYDACRCVRK